MPGQPVASDHSALGATGPLASFPIHLGKVQKPLLPEDTLRRHRLFEWLSSREDRRVTLLVAEAGFGKTTLIADYLRSSQLRAFWYRLDGEDTDGLAFLRYLLASCQAVDGRLLARTAALLNEVSLEPAQETAALRVLLSELDELGEMPSALVLDDFFYADAIPEILAIVDSLIARAPRNLRIIIATRRLPNLAMAGLRARGELSQIGRDELRFDDEETGRLFQCQPLAPDTLRELQARTEGWAASLQLVKAAVEGRSASEVQAFVRSLNGAAGDLYDYLAEEVVGILRTPLREFLLRLAILEEIDGSSAAVASQLDTATAAGLLSEAQAIGLLSRGAGVVPTWRLHPLVREYLLERLESEIGRRGMVELHRILASTLEPKSWRLAARHWAAADDSEQVRRVICSAVTKIIGTGDFATAYDLTARFPDPNPNPFFDILRSRQLASQGRYSEAAELAQRSSRSVNELAQVDGSAAIAAALNAMHLGIHMNDTEMSSAAIASLSCSDDAELASIARSAELLSSSRDGGSLDQLCESLHRTAAISRERSHPRHEGISLVNLSIAEASRGHHNRGVEAGREALRLLEVAGNRADVSAAHLNLAKGLAHTYLWEEAQQHICAGLGTDGEWIEPDTFAEAAELHAMYGDPNRAIELLHAAIGQSPIREGSSYVRQASARLQMLSGRYDEALGLLSLVDSSPIAPGFGSATRALRAQVLASAETPSGDFAQAAEDALSMSRQQQAWFWWKSVSLTVALTSSSENLNRHLSSMEPGDEAHLSIQAELVARRFSDLSPELLERVRGEAIRRPARWRWSLRQVLACSHARTSDTRIAVGLLDIVGDKADVAMLRQFARRKSLRMPEAGRRLAKSLAPRVYVEDLGRVSLLIGEQRIAGTSIRRKVLSLLGFLLTRPQFAASREQVIEALWPDMDPEAGANSLNQTAYFLRRVFNDDGPEDTSANYLDSRAELVWLDPDLVASQSSKCLRLIAAAGRNPSPDLITELANSYKGRFAVDFIYDDWAASYRDNLHAGYLDRIERAIVSDTNTGAFERALTISQLALKADPDAEQIELCLLRLYRRMGAAAAAAEQYSHYAGVLRDQLGIEPPPLESI
jgi:DNA-binding SARP family transcriptional activator